MLPLRIFFGSNYLMNKAAWPEIDMTPSQKIPRNNTGIKSTIITA